MTKQTDGASAEPLREGKYARLERERRFLLAGPPPASAVVATRRITDRYLPGTRLRLRRVEHPDSKACEYKLTQKVPASQPGPVQGLITNTYLSRTEYHLLASLPAAVLAKTRVSVPPLGIDIFGAPLHGLVLAEAEFTTDEAARSFLRPSESVAEVTDDTRFTGGRLAQTPARNCSPGSPSTESTRISLSGGPTELNQSAGIDNCPYRQEQCPCRAGRAQREPLP